MDFSQQQVDDISEIEKQIDGHETGGPKILSQAPEKDKNVTKSLLAALGITVVASSVIALLLVVPFGSRKIAKIQPDTTTETIQLLSPNITVQAEYVNPFSSKAQYSNPFIASKNPFNTTQ